MVSALEPCLSGLGSSPGRGTALCSWARHFTLIVPLFIQVYKRVPANLLLGRGVTLCQLASHPRGGGCERKYTLLLNGSLSLNVELVFTFTLHCKQKQTAPFLNKG